MELKFRNKNNWPVDNVNFIDITPDMAIASNFRQRIIDMSKDIPDEIDYIIAPESRGFIYGAPIAFYMNKGFIPVRKKNKLPEDFTYSIEYEKEYGKDTLCIPKGEYKDKKFYVVDDVFATGGTLLAIKELIEKVGGIYLGISVVLDINLMKDNLNQSSLFNIEDL